MIERDALFIVKSDGDKKDEDTDGT
ncbi:hypothetical protein MADA3029_910014 [Vibrio nigripulchritudo MADA3029]|nr:hypothetical protein VIBNIFTn2_550037 [Vibrio nigripulchritudo FTn2]CCN49865.1 hypothetical protein VIBNIMADA3020_810015 [Vibrio nigripulchritudo MADA3020]CCN62014.1 hypothetical protein MADA3029_910014 [Vibrio nigripulchritudo MADA3029]